MHAAPGVTEARAEVGARVGAVSTTGRGRGGQAEVSFHRTDSSSSGSSTSAPATAVSGRGASSPRPLQLGSRDESAMSQAVSRAVAAAVEEQQHHAHLLQIAAGEDAAEEELRQRMLEWQEGGGKPAGSASYSYSPSAVSSGVGSGSGDMFQPSLWVGNGEGRIVPRVTARIVRRAGSQGSSGEGGRVGGLSFNHPSLGLPAAAVAALKVAAVAAVAASAVAALLFPQRGAGAGGLSWPTTTTATAATVVSPRAGDAGSRVEPAKGGASARGKGGHQRDEGRGT